VLGVVFAASESLLGRATYRPGGHKGTDRGTLPLMIALTTVAAGGAFAAWYFGFGRVPQPLWLGAVGLLVFGCGVALRWWAILSLRGHFTINVTALAEHRLVTAGPYRLLRHPAYTGTLLSLCGLGLAVGNALSLVLLVGFPLVALLIRMRVEEAMLESVFGEDYLAYRQRTWRLVPGIF